MWRPIRRQLTLPPQKPPITRKGWDLEVPPSSCVNIDWLILCRQPATVSSWVQQPLVMSRSHYFAIVFIICPLPPWWSLSLAGRGMIYRSHLWLCVPWTLILYTCMQFFVMGEILGSNRGGKDNEGGIVEAQTLTCTRRWELTSFRLDHTTLGAGRGKSDADRLAECEGESLPTRSSDCFYFLAKQDSRSEGENGREGGLWSLKWWNGYQGM